MSGELKHMEEIVDRLTPDERLKLLQYLASRLGIPAFQKSAKTKAESIAAWERMKEIGREIASEPGNGKSATEILSEMRR